MSSSKKSDTSSERAVDGNTDNYISGGSCAVTKKENDPWFRLDLQKSTEVSKNNKFVPLRTQRSRNRKFEIIYGHDSAVPNIRQNQ